MEIKTRFAGIALAAVVVAAGAFFAITAGRPADRFLTFDGLDPVKIGMTLAEAEEALNAKLILSTRATETPLKRAGTPAELMALIKRSRT